LAATFQNWNFGASVSWELDVWGRFRRAIESADAALESTVENYGAVLVSLDAEVATAYVDIRTLQRQLAYLRGNVEVQKGSLQLSQAQADEGQTDYSGVYLATSNLKSTQASIPALEANMRQANNRLCTLLGRPTTDLLPELGDAPIPSPPPELALGIPANLLRRRPDVRAAERNLAAQSAQIGIAEAELYPQLVLRGEIGVQAEHFSKLWRGDSFTYAAGPSFTWNILNYGRLINNVRFQEAAFQELIATYQNTVLTANQEVEDAVVTYLRTQEEVQFRSENTDALEKALELAMIQFKEGAIDFTQVFVLQSELVLAQDQLAASEGDVIASLIEVYRALGGGWEPLPPEEIASLRGPDAEEPPGPATTQPNEPSSDEDDEQGAG